MEDLEQAVVCLRDLVFKIAFDKHYLYREQEEVLRQLHELMQTLERLQAAEESVPLQQVEAQQRVP